MQRDEAMAKYKHICKSSGAIFAYGTLVAPDWAAKLTQIPGHMHECLVEWVLFGHLEDDFLTAVLNGDLFEAAKTADDANRSKLFEWASVLHNAVPSQCFRPTGVSTWKGLFPA